MEQIEVEQDRQFGIALEPAGIGGWLLYVCVMMTIIGPVRVIVGDLGALHRTRALMHLSPGWSTYCLFLYSIDMLKVAFSIYAGTGLWRLRRHAVETAVLCFLALPFYPFTAWVVGMALTHGANQFHRMNFFQGVGAAVLWISYLQLSKMVRNTYCRPESPALLTGQTSL